MSMNQDDNGKIQIKKSASIITIIKNQRLKTARSPLDALIQRFGRINRRFDSAGGKFRKGICPVYVCEKGGENDHYIYPKDIVENTLKVLGRISEIRENELQGMLDEVYPDWVEKEKFLKTKEGFLVALNRLRPFMAFREQEEVFYKKFTGVPVLPVKFRQDYENYIEQFDFFKAESLFVNLHLGMFHKLAGEKRLEKSSVLTKKNNKPKEIPYWIAMCRYDSDLGLLENEEEEFHIETKAFSF